MESQPQGGAGSKPSEPSRTTASKELSISSSVRHVRVTHPLPSAYRAALASEDNAFSISLYDHSRSRRQAVEMHVYNQVLAVGGTGLVQAVLYMPGEFVFVYRSTDHRTEAFESLKHLRAQDYIKGMDKIGPILPRKYITWSIKLPEEETLDDLSVALESYFTDAGFSSRCILTSLSHPAGRKTVKFGVKFEHAPPFLKRTLKKLNQSMEVKFDYKLTTINPFPSTDAEQIIRDPVLEDTQVNDDDKDDSSDASDEEESSGSKSRQEAEQHKPALGSASKNPPTDVHDSDEDSDSSDEIQSTDPKDAPIEQHTPEKNTATEIVQLESSDPENETTAQHDTLDQDAFLETTQIDSSDSEPDQPPNKISNPPTDPQSPKRKTPPPSFASETCLAKRPKLANNPSPFHNPNARGTQIPSFPSTPNTKPTFGNPGFPPSKPHAASPGQIHPATSSIPTPEVSSGEVAAEDDPLDLLERHVNEQLGNSGLR